MEYFLDVCGLKRFLSPNKLETDIDMIFSKKSLPYLRNVLWHTHLLEKLDQTTSIHSLNQSKAKGLGLGRKTS